MTISRQCITRMIAKQQRVQSKLEPYLSSRCSQFRLDFSSNHSCQNDAPIFLLMSCSIFLLACRLNFVPVHWIWRVATGKSEPQSVTMLLHSVGTFSPTDCGPLVKGRPLVPAKLSDARSFPISSLKVGSMRHTNDFGPVLMPTENEGRQR